jgi:hypothetical protein
MKTTPIEITTVDCVAYPSICRGEQQIIAFPTLRLYQNGEAVAPDYKTDRSVNALKAFVKRHLETTSALNVDTRASHDANDESHAGHLGRDKLVSRYGTPRYFEVPESSSDADRDDEQWSILPRWLTALW